MSYRYFVFGCVLYGFLHLQVVRNLERDVALLTSIRMSATHLHCGYHFNTFYIPAYSIPAFPLYVDNDLFTLDFSHSMCSKGAMVAPCYVPEPGS